LKVFSTLEPSTRKNMLILFGSGLFFWSSLASLLPTLPPYIQKIGGNDQEVGLVMGAFALGLLFCRSWLGKVADKKSRQELLLIGAIVGAIAPFGFAAVNTVLLLFLIRAFHGISVAAFTTGYSALVVDLSPIQTRGELLGYMSLVTPIGIAIGPAIGGILEVKMGAIALFYLAGFLSIIATIGISQIKENSSLNRQKNHENIQGEDKYLKRILTNHALFIPTIVLLMIGFAVGAISSFIPLYIKQSQIDFNAGWFYSIAAIASFSCRLIAGKKSDIYGRGIFITGSLIAYILAMLCLFTGKNTGSFILAALLEGTATGTILPMMIALLSDRSDPQERGRVFSLCISGFDLGIAIASPLFGAIAAKVNYGGIFGLCAVLALLALILFITQCSKNISESLKFSLKGGEDIYAFK
jgi:MFS family permease